MEEIQERIEVEMEQITPEQPAEKKARAPRKRRAIPIPKREGAKIRLEKFDFILLQLLKEGKSDIAEIRAIFNVNDGELMERLKSLGEGGYVSFSTDAKSIFLGMRGINDHSLKWKKAADEWLGRKERKIPVKREEKKEEAPAFDNGQQASNHMLDLAHSIQAKLPVEILWKEIEQRHVQIQELPEEKRQEETIDIMDLMRRYGPTDEQKKQLKKTSPFVERHMPKKEAKGEEGIELDRNGETPMAGSNGKASPSSQPGPAEKQKPFYNRVISEMSSKAAEIDTSGEKCELCKTGFMISVKAEEHNPKYGHCFCGAPYHKDCFEAVIADDTKCVRCGRKLGGGGADFKVEEAFKQITDISY